MRTLLPTRSPFRKRVRQLHSLRGRGVHINVLFGPQREMVHQSAREDAQTYASHASLPDLRQHTSGLVR